MENETRPAPTPSEVPTEETALSPSGRREEESQWLANRAAVQFTFPLEPERAQSLQWEGDMILVCASESLYFLNLDAEQEAAPTYLRLPAQNPQEDLLSHHEQTMYAWKHVSAARITCARLSPPMPWGRGPSRRQVAMASSQGALGLYSEVVVGEWVAHGNLLPLMIDALSRVELETYLTQCMTWIAWKEEALLLVASKDGTLFVFWVWGESARLVQWAHLAPAQSWISALTGHILQEDDQQVDVQVTMGFSHGGLSRTVLEVPLRTHAPGPTATQPEVKILVQAGGSPVKGVGICPWNGRQLDWISGCHWCRLNLSGSERARQVVASSTLATDLEWNVKERQVMVVSLDGSLQVYNDAMRPVGQYRYAQANWGLYGVCHSPNGLHVATLAKTPKGEEKMFNTLSSKSVLDVRLPEALLKLRGASLLDMVLQEWEWPEEPETYWDKQAALFQAHRLEWYGETLLPRLLSDMEALPWHEASTWTSEVFRRLQFLHSMLVQCQRRGITLPASGVDRVRSLLFRRHVENCLQRFVSLSSQEQAVVLQSAGALRALQRMIAHLQSLSLPPGGSQRLLEQGKALVPSLEEGGQEETCGLCQGPMTGSTLEVGRVTCQAGHSLDRCLISLVPLVRSGNFLCYGCRGHMQNTLVQRPDEWSWAYGDTPPSCPYCRLPFRPFVPI